jgi:hypothetical protein
MGRVALAWVGLGVVVWLACGLFETTAHAQAREPEARESSESEEEVPPAGEQLDDPGAQRLRELALQISQLERRGNLPSDVAGSLGEAKLALARMREAWAKKNRKSQESLERLARASIALAERRYSLALERELNRAAVARRELARARVESSQRAVEAEARRLQELTEQAARTPGAPALPAEAGAVPAAPVSPEKAASEEPVQ